MSGELDNDGFFNQLERDTLWKWVKYLEDGGEQPKTYHDAFFSMVGGKCEVL